MVKKVIYTACFIVLHLSLFAQSFDTKFGKNRVQYNNDFKYWSQYESDNFIVYWYGKGKNISQSVIQMAELDHDEIRKNIEHRISDKLEIIVYVDLNDFKQSNIGSEEVVSSESGETKIIGNKLLVYFDGNHHHLRERIKEGIANVYFSSMQFGGNIQEVVQNAVLLNFPVWYKPGFISYIGSNWNILIEDELRDILERDKKNFSFQKLARKHPRVAGHSMWYYLKSNYGKTTISNLLYLTRITKNFSKSVEFVLNTNMKQVYSDWANFYKAKYAAEENKFSPFIGDEIILKNKKYRPISLLSPDPQDEYLLYSTIQNGKVRLYLHDLTTKKSEKIFSFGYKNKFQEMDFEYPHATWFPKGNQFTFTYQKKDRIYINRFDVSTKIMEEQLLPSEFQRIYNISYIDARYYLINASVDGHGDLFIYDSKERESIQLTNDYFDDLDAIVTNLKGKQYILFSSNRTVDHFLPMKADTTLPLDNFDIFSYELPIIQSKEDIKSIPKSLNRITNTSNQNERYPLLNADDIYYIDEVSGIKNLYTIPFEGGNTTCKSNLSRNIIRHGLSNKGNNYYYTLYHEGKYKTMKFDVDRLENVNAFYTPFIQAKNRNIKIISQDPKPAYIEIPEHLKFQSPFKDITPSISITNTVAVNPIREAAEEESKKTLGVKPIINTLIFAAGLKFRIDKFTARMDNEVLFEGMEIAQGTNNQVNQLPAGFLLKAAFTDLFEDYNIEAGTRISTRFDGAEYFLTFDDEKKFLDKGFALYLRNFTERSRFDFVPPIISKKQIRMAMYKLKYPIDIHQSIRGNAFLRSDKQYLKSSEVGTLGYDPIEEKRIGLRLEYVFDNSFENSINVLHGSRLKFYTEAFNEFNFELFSGPKFKLSNGHTFSFGFDARHYIPVLDHSVLAFRGTAAISLGSKENIYYLGGVNNSLFPSFNNDVELPNEDFAFKNNVPHLRGFDSNIRNGSRYVLSNAELRVPIFKYLLGRERGAAFFRNFQVVGFFDAGFAWYGSSPYSSKNPLNTVNIDGPLVDLNIQYFRDPLVYGYGYGIRTQILGYYVRIDLANGVETKSVLPKKLHIGLGYDF